MAQEGFTASIFVNDTGYRKKFKGRLAILNKVIVKAMEKAGKDLVKQVKDKIHDESGALRSQMSYKVSKKKIKGRTDNAHSYFLIVGQLKKTRGGFVPYARIWDKGGTIKPRGDNPFGAKKLAIPMRTPMAIKAGIWRSPRSRTPRPYARDVIGDPEKYGLYSTWSTKNAIMGKIKRAKNDYYNEAIFARIDKLKVYGDGYITKTVRENRKNIKATIKQSVGEWAEKS